MTEIINDGFWWIGAIVFSLCALYGFSELAFWSIDKIRSSLGLWPDFSRVLIRMYRERRLAEEAKAIGDKENG